MGIKGGTVDIYSELFCRLQAVKKIRFIQVTNMQWPNLQSTCCWLVWQLCENIQNMSTSVAIFYRTLVRDCNCNGWLQYFAQWDVHRDFDLLKSCANCTEWILGHPSVVPTHVGRVQAYARVGMNDTALVTQCTCYITQLKASLSSILHEAIITSVTLSMSHHDHFRRHNCLATR